MLSEEIVDFFEHQSFTIISTIDKQGRSHNACKGIVKIGREGKIYLLDLYHGRTFNNLQNNPNISITAVDEHKFKGYCLKGKARIVDKEELEAGVISDWENNLNSRITQRVIRSIQGYRGHKHQPEALLPSPKYLIEMAVEEVVDLTPAHIKEKK
ncbi:MAG: pyridoxamine 5'-phosphate oxidase family protein [Candidatus Omnitrophota bacterium]